MSGEKISRAELHECKHELITKDTRRRWPLLVARATWGCRITHYAPHYAQIAALHTGRKGTPPKSAEAKGSSLSTKVKPCAVLII